MTVTYKHCEYYEDGKCKLEQMKWGWEYPCNKRSNCIDLKPKKGYDIQRDI